jgi:hypothetical protein
MSKLLINESPLMVSPTLAEKVGLNEALVLQQIHYLINPEFNKNLIDGKHWVYNTYSEWHKKFKFWSMPTIKRTFQNLEKLKLLEVGRFNNDSANRTKWYTIDYAELTRLEVGTSDQNDPMQRIKLIPSMGSKRSHATDQFDPMYIEQKITKQKITTKDNNARARDGVSVDKINGKPSIDLSVDLSLIKLENKENLEYWAKKAEAIPKLQERLVAMFDMFWGEYPHKVGKGAARKSFEKALKKTSLASILIALKSQKIEREQAISLGVWVSSWAYPSTWLNEERWDNEVKTPESLKVDAQLQWTQKMSYRDRTGIQGSLERNQRKARLQARLESQAALENHKHVTQGCLTND